MKQLVFLLLLAGTAVADEPKGVQTHKMYNDCKTVLRIIDNPSSLVNVYEARDGWYCLGYLDHRDWLYGDGAKYFSR